MSIHVHVGNCGSAFYQEGGCLDGAVLIGHIRLIQAYVLLGGPEPVSVIR